MKKSYNKNKPDTPKKNSVENTSSNSETEIENVTNELIDLARRRLPLGSLQGVLRGYEEDIRQDATLLSLNWYLCSNNTCHGHKQKYSWYAPRAIAGALRVTTRDYVKRLKSEIETLQSLSFEDQSLSRHPSTLRFHEWPIETAMVLTSRAIRIAHRLELISDINADIAKQVLVCGKRVTDVAEQLNTHRSNVYQHLNRVRSIIPSIIDDLEISLTQQ